MLLSDWLLDAGAAVPAEFKRGCIDQVLRFVFGENYAVQMKDGRSYEDKSLEPMLAVMLDEFRVFNTTHALTNDAERYHPVVEVLDVSNPSSSGPGKPSDPLGQRSRRSLVVSVVKGWNGALPPATIEAVADQVRSAVTMFSLTGEWDTIGKTNL